MQMDLTRRDALAALGATGAVIGGASVLALRDSDGDGEWDLPDGPGGEADDLPDEISLGTLVALGEVLYPSEVSGIEDFLETYVLGRIENRAAYRTGMIESIAFLDDRAESWHGDRFADLDSSDRHSLLRELGIDTADPDPGGGDPSRIRYFLVNELLFAFYASPTGGELVGIENPQGYPGGIESYQRGPDE